MYARSVCVYVCVCVCVWYQLQTGIRLLTIPASMHVRTQYVCYACVCVCGICVYVCGRRAYVCMCVCIYVRHVCVYVYTFMLYMNAYFFLKRRGESCRMSSALGA